MATCKDCFHWNACKKMLEAMWGHCVPSGYEGGADRCEDFINTADVAPRAEVAREICCKIEEEIVAALESNYRARKEHIERNGELVYDTELLLEINGKINALRGIEGFVEELKKKYAEGEK